MMVSSSEQAAAIQISHVWKIFGKRQREAYEAASRYNMPKQQILEKYNCVVGVADVSFRVLPGQIYCVMGLSGSGKSTLVRHINRLLEPTDGGVFVNNTDVMALQPSALQEFRNRHIAMVFQNFALMPHRSVLDNIAMPLEIRGINKNKRLEIAEQNLHLVELSGWGNKFAHELSGGMQQRVGLARALASNPDILLMDEPFSALDPLIRRQLQNQFMVLAEKMNKTTVFITHDLDEAIRIGDRIAIMRDGRLVQEGKPEDIVLHPADDYVADFVAGISRLKIVRARTIMLSLAEFKTRHGTVPDDCPVFDEDTSLNILVRAMVEHDKPLVIIDKSDNKIGVIGQNQLLQILVEGSA